MLRRKEDCYVDKSVYDYYARTQPKGGGYASYSGVFSQRAKDTDQAPSWLILFIFQSADTT